MKPFLFVINIIPSSRNKDFEYIAGGKAHVWVITEDREDAKLKAIDYITRTDWQIVDFEFELEIHKEQIPKLHEDEARLYQIALQSGIAADYLVHKKV